jgi:hypothetical protein
MKKPPKKRGRKAGVSMFANVLLADLNKALKEGSVVPVSYKFAAALQLLLSSPKPIIQPAQNNLTPEETSGTIQVEEEDWS